MSFFAHHPIMLVAVPLAFAAVCPLLGLWRRDLCYWWALLGAAATSFCAWALVGSVRAGAAVAYDLGDWPPPWGIRLRIDRPALMVACAVTSAVLLMMVYSYRRSSCEDGAARSPGVYSCTLMLLGTAGALGVISSGDLFNMLLFVQVTGVAAAGFVAARGGSRAARAAFGYLVALTGSAVMFLLATGLLYSVTGALDMKKISLQLQVLKQGYVPVAVVSLVVSVLALAVPSALFPASWWLADAATASEEPAGALLAGTVVSVCCFTFFRVLYSVFSPGLSKVETARSMTANTLAWVGMAAFVFGAVTALFQDDLERIAARCSISQAGLVVTGIAATSHRALAGGLLAVVSGVVGISCMFLSVSALTHGCDVRGVRDLRGMGRRRPVAASAFALASLSLVGVPFTIGFTAKWELAGGLLDRGWYVPVLLLFLGSAAALLCLGRVVYLLFAEAESKCAGRPPLAMSAVSLAFGLGAVALGALGHALTTWLLEAIRPLLTW